MTKDAVARDYLDYYLDRPGNPDFAVMLEGPWGSGKSFFIERYFSDRLEKARAKEKKAKPEIRVSLFGVRDLSEITYQIFAATHPLLAGKAAKITNVIFSRAVSIFGLSVDPKENTNLLQEALMDLQDRVLIFDDFERCPMPLVEVMGYINRFVEHDKLKVIVIASEQDIPNEQQEDYRTRKEKLFGKTIKVGSDPGEVLDVFTGIIRHPKALEAIVDNRDKLLATFMASGQPNFRSLRAVLLDFERLVSLLGEPLHSSKVALGQLLLYVVALGIEFRSNTIDENGLWVLQNHIQLHLNKGASIQGTSNEKKHATTLRQRYEYVSFDDPIVHPENLSDLFASGSFDIATVEDHISRHPTVVGHAQVPAWRLMWDWSRLSQVEYKKAKEQLQAELSSLSIIKIGEILHIVGISIRLKEFGEQLFESKDISDYFSSYVESLERENMLEPAPELFREFGDSYEGLMFPARESQEFREIYRLMANASEKALDRKMLDLAPDLLNRLKENSYDAAMLFHLGLEAGCFGGVPILKHIDVSDFADLILSDGKINKEMVDSLKRRYQIGFEKTLRSEVKWIVDLYSELMCRARNLLPPHRKLAIDTLEREFENINTRIELIGSDSI